MSKVSKDLRNSSKKQNSIGPPINIKRLINHADMDHPLINKLVNSNNADEQLGILKLIFNNQNDLSNLNIVKILAAVYYNTPAKHPVKCFLTKNITKCNDSIQQSFTEALSMQILPQSTYPNFNEFADVVEKVISCIENFPAGAAAVKLIDVKLAKYLLSYFGLHRSDALSDPQASSSTKTDVYKLDHQVVRLLVHIIQKLQPDYDNGDDAEYFLDLWSWVHCIAQLICDEDVPMDTKCLSGILLIHIDIMRSFNKHCDYEWRRWLFMESNINMAEAHIMKPLAGQLAVYAGILTLVPIHVLEKKDVHYSKNEGPGILILSQELLNIAESGVSDQALTLAVARTLLHASKLLASITDVEVGVQTMELVLQFVWTHLEFHLDSVRHLAHQILAVIFDYCADLDKNGRGGALATLVGALRALGECRSLYVAAGRAAPHRPDLCPPTHLLRATIDSHLQAAAVGAIDAILNQFPKDVHSIEIFLEWVQPLLDLVETADCSAMTVLRELLAKILQRYPAVATHIKSGEVSLRNELVMAAASVGRGGDGEVSYALLHRVATLTSVEIELARRFQNRLLALSLVVENEKTTAPLTRCDLTFVLHFLKYNIDAPSQNFRHLMLANVKKLLKRMDKSYRVLSRRGGGGAEHYVWFWEELRSRWLRAPLPAAAAPRRAAALELLRELYHATRHHHPLAWREEHVEILLQILDDNYETNKAMALDILQYCPQQLLKSNGYSTSLKLADILDQASSMKPSESVSAAYKLRLLLDKLPERIIEETASRKNNLCEGAPSAVLEALVGRVGRALGGCGRCAGARGGSAFGPLHCVAALLPTMLPWLQSAAAQPAVAALLAACSRAAAAAEPVVCAASPEGHLPPHALLCNHKEDDKPVTSQMALVHAWRTVKEASWVACSLAAAAAQTGAPWAAEEAAGAAWLARRAQHRGAAAAAAAALAVAALAFWKEPSLSAVCAGWVRGAGGGGARCATRRGAGLPYLLQSLLSTQVSATGSSSATDACMRHWLTVARCDPPETSCDPPEITCDPSETSCDLYETNCDPPETSCDPPAARRTLAANVLRALFRDSRLQSAVQPYIGEGLHVAITGFAADTWPERTAMGLLLSALHVRVFGVERRRALAPHPRNMAPARRVFRTYPTLYRHMLNIVKEASEDKKGSTLRPSLIPVLLILARLYPSGLEGTDSDMKLSAFVPLLVRSAGHSARATRGLLARALRPLVPPAGYASHMEWMFNILSNPAIGRNYCHGILLQVEQLLDAAPPSQRLDHLRPAIANTLWILQQCLGPRPCYLIADEFVKIINLLVWRFPEVLKDDTITPITTYLKEILFTENIPPITSGRDICLANCVYLYLIMLHNQKNVELIARTTLSATKHKSYEVVEATLNFCLMLHGQFDDETTLEQHLKSICDVKVLDILRKSPKYFTSLSDILHGNKYQECQIKAIRLLTLESGTQRAIFRDCNTDGQVMSLLITSVQISHEKMTHMYLESLLNFLEEKSGDVNFMKWFLLKTIAVVLDSSSADNSEETRHYMVAYLKTNINKMLTTYFDMIHDSHKFLYKATVLATLVTLLEDDDEDIKQRAANIAATLSRGVNRGHIHEDGDLGEELVPSVCGEMFRDYVQSLEDHTALFVVLALLDFNSDVCITDEIDDECRVFDQGERHNIEEAVWTAECANKIINIHKEKDDLIELVLSVVRDHKYSHAIRTLCKDNVALFEEMAKDNIALKDKTINPKIELFIRQLRLKCYD